MSGDSNKASSPFGQHHSINVGDIGRIRKLNDDKFMEAPKSILGGSDYVSEHDNYKTQNSDLVSPGKATILRDKLLL